MINIEKLKFPFAVLCIAVFLGASMISAAGQVLYTSGLGTSGSDTAYCVNSGYLYRTVPGINSGRGICQFSDGTWCDAHAFFIGNCTPRPSISIMPGIVTPGGYIVPSVSYNPYYYNHYYYSNPAFANVSQTALDIAVASRACQRAGGIVNTVHTAYGDVRLCIFPDGNSIDLSQLYGEIYGGAPGPVVPSTAVYVNGVPTDSWFYYAYSWLNAP